MKATLNFWLNSEVGYLERYHFSPDDRWGIYNYDYEFEHERLYNETSIDHSGSLLDKNALTIELSKAHIGRPI